MNFTLQNRNIRRTETLNLRTCNRRTAASVAQTFKDFG